MLRAKDRRSELFLETKTSMSRGPDLRMGPKIYSFAWSIVGEHIVAISRESILRKWSSISKVASCVAQLTRKYDAAWLGFLIDNRIIASIKLLSGFNVVRLLNMESEMFLRHIYSDLSFFLFLFSPGLWFLFFFVNSSAFRHMIRSH